MLGVHVESRRPVFFSHDDTFSGELNEKSSFSVLITVVGPKHCRYMSWRMPPCCCLLPERAMLWVFFFLREHQGMQTYIQMKTCRSITWLGIQYRQLLVPQYGRASLTSLRLTLQIVLTRINQRHGNKSKTYSQNSQAIVMLENLESAPSNSWKLQHEKRFFFFWKHHVKAMKPNEMNQRILMRHFPVSCLVTQRPLLLNLFVSFTQAPSVITFISCLIHISLLFSFYRRHKNPASDIMADPKSLCKFSSNSRSNRGHRHMNHEWISSHLGLQPL